MNEIISYCGLQCQSCPVFLLKEEPDKEKRNSVVYNLVKMCRELYGIEYEVKDINGCDGCKSEDSRVFLGCKSCKVRICASKKKIENCALCEQYACETLLEIFITEPGAKECLDSIRSRIQG